MFIPARYLIRGLVHWETKGKGGNQKKYTEIETCQNQHGDTDKK